MKNTTSIRIKQLMSERKLKQVDILRMSEPFQKRLDIKMGKSALSQYVSGKQSPDQDRIYLLSKTLNVSEPWLMGYDVPKERVPDEERNISVSSKLNSIYNQLEEFRQRKVFNFAENQLEEQNEVVRFQTKESTPHYGGVAANPTELVYGDTIYDEQVTSDVPKDADGALTIHGDSMEELFSDGDICFFKRQPDIENGEIAIVEIDGTGVTCKKVIKENGCIILRSLNTKYDDREIKKESVRIIGKVIV